MKVFKVYRNSIINGYWSKNYEAEDSGDAITQAFLEFPDLQDEVNAIEVEPVRTADGVVYQNGMTLYSVVFPDPDFGTSYYVSRHLDTTAETFAPSRHYADRTNAVKKIIKVLVEERDELNETISRWENEL